MPDGEYFDKYLEQRFATIDAKLDSLHQDVDALHQDVDALRQENGQTRLEIRQIVSEAQKETRNLVNIALGRVDEAVASMNCKMDEMTTNFDQKFRDLSGRVNTMQNLGWGIMLTFVGVLVTLITVSIRG